MHIRKVVSPNSLRACRTFLKQDPITNILVLGDLYQPLFSVSDIYCAMEKHRAVGVCSIYRAFSTPSIVFGASEPEVKRALLETALKKVSDKFVSLCTPTDINLLTQYSTLLHLHHEQQMTANFPKQVKHEDVEVTKVQKNELEELNSFYTQHNAEAWTPIQFETGPYYCVKQEGEIVSAAGVHIVTPQIAQLGNIITDEAYRNKGFATQCTYSLATDLASKGRIISLFVRADNAPAIRMYEKLGFSKKRDISFLIMQKKT
ncbi:MAG TPA: GNAT family N-acetyltransferase [Candidatus Acidoferrum sp.]|nr:GNAT family N-acetyltransferase [Candidatus Acidoferrum sp.]